MKRILSLKNSIILLSVPFLKCGYLCSSISKLFKDKYEINFWNEELGIIKSRISCVQKHEERRGFCQFYGI